jgi:hypothetical protein
MYSQVPDERAWSVAQKLTTLRLAGSFAYRKTITQQPDRPSLEHPCANRNDPLFGDPLILGDKELRDFTVEHCV